MPHDLPDAAAVPDIKQNRFRRNSRAADTRPTAHDLGVTSDFDNARLSRWAEHGGHVDGIAATPPTDESGAPRRGPAGAVFEDNAGSGELVADAVGFREIFGRAGGRAGGNPFLGHNLLLWSEATRHLFVVDA